MFNVEKIRQELERAGFVWSDVLAGFYDWWEVFEASPTIQNLLLDEFQDLIADARRDIKNYMRGEYVELRINFRDFTRNLLTSLSP